MAARTIPFPTPPGTAVTRRVPPSPPPPPPTSAAKLIPAPRRYRGLHLVSKDCIVKVSQHINSLAQTRAIVAQVEREIEQHAAKTRLAPGLQLLTATPGSSASLSSRAAQRLVLSLFPAGL